MACWAWLLSQTKQFHHVRELSGQVASLHVNSGETIYRALMAGLGIGLLPDWMVRQELATGRLVEVLTNCRAELSEDFDSAAYVVYSPIQTPPKVRAFIAFLVGVLKS